VNTLKPGLKSVNGKQKNPKNQTKISKTQTKKH
jgi:hypothetical protein